MKKEIITGLYQEKNSKRKPLYTTELKSKCFGGRHFTLEDLIKEIIDVPKIITFSGTNRKDREAIAKIFKITIEEI